MCGKKVILSFITRFLGELVNNFFLEILVVVGNFFSRQYYKLLALTKARNTTENPLGDTSMPNSEDILNGFKL